MSTYTPDTWVILRIENKDTKETVNKVLAGWYGGYTSGDSWKLNSGITKIIDKETHYEIYGYSGSVYNCNKASEKLSGLMGSVLRSWEKELPTASFEVVPVSEVLNHTSA